MHDTADGIGSREGVGMLSKAQSVEFLKAEFDPGSPKLTRVDPKALTLMYRLAGNHPGTLRQVASSVHEKAASNDGVVDVTAVKSTMDEMLVEGAQRADRHLRLLAEKGRFDELAVLQALASHQNSFDSGVWNPEPGVRIELSSESLEHKRRIDRASEQLKQDGLVVDEIPGQGAIEPRIADPMMIGGLASVDVERLHQMGPGMQLTRSTNPLDVDHTVARVASEGSALVDGLDGASVDDADALFLELANSAVEHAESLGVKTHASFLQRTKMALAGVGMALGAAFTVPVAASTLEDTATTGVAGFEEPSAEQRVHDISSPEQSLPLLNGEGGVYRVGEQLIIANAQGQSFNEVFSDPEVLAEMASYDIPPAWIYDNQREWGSALARGTERVGYVHFLINGNDQNSIELHKRLWPSPLINEGTLKPLVRAHELAHSVSPLYEVDYSISGESRAEVKPSIREESQADVFSVVWAAKALTGDDQAAFKELAEAYIGSVAGWRMEGPISGHDGIHQTVLALAKLEKALSEDLASIHQLNDPIGVAEFSLQIVDKAHSDLTEALQRHGVARKIGTMDQIDKIDDLKKAMLRGRERMPNIEWMTVAQKRDAHVLYSSARKSDGETRSEFFEKLKRHVLKTAVMANESSAHLIGSEHGAALRKDLLGPISHASVEAFEAYIGGSSELQSNQTGIEEGVAYDSAP
ncbi:hypothetical protein [Ferrimonas marina]|nr:hypothetical protein [Ferrimonas marina]